MGSSDVAGNFVVWLRDRLREVARDMEMKGQKHAVHMLQAYGA